jgi:hypothetical protein
MFRVLVIGALAALTCAAAGKTVVSIKGDQFLLNGQPTYKGRTWQGHKIEGLLMNSRMVQGIYDDTNAATAKRWAYKDTGKWDAERNVREFLAAMPEWRKHGCLRSPSICRAEVRRGTRRSSRGSIRQSPLTGR